MRPRRLDPSVGASFGLSILIVGAAAVALRPARDSSTLAVALPTETVPAPTPSPAEARVLPEQPAEAPSPPSPDGPGPDIPVAATEFPDPILKDEAGGLQGPLEGSTVPAPSTLADEGRDGTPEVRGRDVAMALPSPASKSGPRPDPEPRPSTIRKVSVVEANAPALPLAPTFRPSPGFATSQPGESLTDVAARVLGSADAAEALWRANRDQLESPESPLRAGTLLRTP